MIPMQFEDTYSHVTLPPYATPLRSASPLSPPSVPQPLPSPPVCASSRHLTPRLTLRLVALLRAINSIVDTGAVLVAAEAAAAPSGADVIVWVLEVVVVIQLRSVVRRRPLPWPNEVEEEAASGSLFDVLLPPLTLDGFALLIKVMEHGPLATRFKEPNRCNLLLCAIKKHIGNRPVCATDTRPDLTHDQPEARRRAIRCHVFDPLALQEPTGVSMGPGVSIAHDNIEGSQVDIIGPHKSVWWALADQRLVDGIRGGKDGKKGNLEGAVKVRQCRTDLQGLETRGAQTRQSFATCGGADTCSCKEGQVVKSAGSIAGISTVAVILLPAAGMVAAWASAVASLMARRVAVAGGGSDGKRRSATPRVT